MSPCSSSVEVCVVGIYTQHQELLLAVMSKVLAAIELNEERFLALLTNLIGEAQHLQNNPAQGPYFFCFFRLKDLSVIVL
jgi:hypothetical protein